jgi:DNA-binding GntR family transcriptional regulator
VPRKRKDEEIAPAVSALEEDVIFGRLRPFERLTEEDVMTRFNLTRHLSRRVFQRLEELGIVTGDRAGGTVVRAFSLEEIEHIYEVREALQEQAMRRIRLPASPALVANLRATHERYVDAVFRTDLPAIFRLNESFHDTLFGACGNPVLADAIKKYTWLTHGVRSRGFADRNHLNLAIEEHGKLIDALMDGDRRTLVEVNRIHVNRPKEAYVASQRWPTAGVPPNRVL